MNYQIIVDEQKLDEFIEFLPETKEAEVYYFCLFGRHKYANEFPHNKNEAGQLARVISRKSDLKQKIARLSVPVNSYSRNGIVAPQEALALYIGINPRSLLRANKNLLITMATRIAEGDLEFNPISVATTEVHRAIGTKYFVDFDYDDVDPVDYLSRIKEILPDNSYKILKTRGGFHLIVILEKIENSNKLWYQQLSALPNCDIKGANTLTPVPGCTQGGFVPYFV